MNVPTERRELHDQDHLGASDINRLRIVDDLAVDVADGHVAHQEDEADPGHQRSINVVGDQIGTGGAIE